MILNTKYVIRVEMERYRGFSTLNRADIFFHDKFFQPLR